MLLAEFVAKKADSKPFFEQVGKIVMLGLHGDSTNRIIVVQLPRYHTAQSGAAQISLREHVGRQREGRNATRCITGAGTITGFSSPSCLPRRAATAVEAD